jgi:hypothetical protein
LDSTTQVHTNFSTSRDNDFVNGSTVAFRSPLDTILGQDYSRHARLLTNNIKTTGDDEQTNPSPLPFSSTIKEQGGTICLSKAGVNTVSNHTGCLSV